MNIMKRSIPLGGGMWVTRWYVMKDMRVQYDITNNLTDQEPRIQLERTTVIPDRENQEYYITLQINSIQCLFF